MVDDVQVHLYAGDNLPILQRLAERYRGEISLVYMDPPFFTLRQHERVIREHINCTSPQRTLTPAFDDRWNSFSSYLEAIQQRIKAIYPLLSMHGSLVVHLDSRASHYVKVMVDKIFGIECFASEIVWRYRRWPTKTRNFQRVHDVLLRWVRSVNHKPRFVRLYEPLASSTLRKWGKGKQRAVTDDQGRRIRSTTQNQPSPGVAMGDVWDIGIIAPTAKQRTGYPTQKPEELLQRLILSCSLPHDWVLDPYAGSGTTLSVAWKTGRNAIGIDSSPEAIAVTSERLQAQGCDISPILSEDWVQSKICKTTA